MAKWTIDAIKKKVNSLPDLTDEQLELRHILSDILDELEELTNKLERVTNE